MDTIFIQEFLELLHRIRRKSKAIKKSEIQSRMAKPRPDGSDVIPRKRSTASIRPY